MSVVLSIRERDGGVDEAAPQRSTRCGGRPAGRSVDLGSRVLARLPTFELFADSRVDISCALRME